jgi:hypothetical protein
MMSFFMVTSLSVEVAGERGGIIFRSALIGA